MPNWRREAILDVYNVLFGLVLLVSPWLFAYAHGIAAIDMEASGVAVVLVSIAAIVAFSDREEWLNVVLGLWLTASPWVLHFAHTTAAHVSVIVGIAIVFIAVLELWLVHYAKHTTPGSYPIPGGRKGTYVGPEGQ